MAAARYNSVRKNAFIFCPSEVVLKNISPQCSQFICLDRATQPLGEASQEHVEASPQEGGGKGWVSGISASSWINGFLSAAKGSSDCLDGEPKY